MAQLEYTITLKFRWWVNPLMHVLQAFGIGYCMTPGGVSNLARFIVSRGTILS